MHQIGEKNKVMTGIFVGKTAFRGIASKLDNSMGEKRLPELALCIFSNKNRIKKALHERNSNADINFGQFCCYNFIPRWVVSSVGRAADS